MARPRPAVIAAPAALHRPPPVDLAVIAVALAGVSTSGPLIAATAAPALAIAFWRNAMATGLLVPWALVRVRAELAGLSRREWVLAVGAGALLAAHFATWVPAVRLSSVASATALVATQPIWAALIARARGQEIPAGAWVGTVVAVAGAAVLAGADVTVSWRALGGDALALAGGALAAAYVSVGGEVRRSVTTTSYTAICYATAAVLLLVLVAASGRPLTGYSANAWAKLAALTVAAQLLGHSMFNRVLRTTSATIVSLSILFEVPGAALIAALWLHQRPGVAALGGVALLLAGIAAVVVASPRPAPPAVPAE